MRVGLSLGLALVTGFFASADGSSSSAAVGDGAIRIDARFASATRGTFRVTGAVSDSGSLAATRRISGGRAQIVETLAGKAGVLRIRATTSCGTGRGTWRLVSGTNAYAGLLGEGAASGPRCGSAFPASATYTGQVRTPRPPPLANAGHYGGATSQREEVTFDVQEGGRALTSLRLLVKTPCEGTPITGSVLVNVLGPIAIGADRAFSATSTLSSGTGEASGRFTSPTSAEGTAAASTTVTVSSTNTTYKCSAELSWKASLPPPTATPGRYCGFTTQGSSVCFDVDQTGRAVKNLEVGVVVQCNQRSTELELQLTFGDTSIGGNLGFRVGTTSFEGFMSGGGGVSGLIDPDGGGASGSVFVQPTEFDYEGSRYRCRNTSATWTARRQA